MIHESVVSCIGATPLVRLSRCFPEEDVEVVAKLEFLNPGGSVKDRPARQIVEHALQAGAVQPGGHLIESTSGNFGVALAMVARVHRLRFTAVVDPKITSANRRLLGVLGARVEVVSTPDQRGGFLESRLRRVRELLDRSPEALWINQYANELNTRAHYETTGAEIIADVGRKVDCLVAAVSTTGTILGLARRLRAEGAEPQVVAVDAVGSVIFGGRPGPREVPGIGSSRVPELLVEAEIDRVVYVTDREAALACRELVSAEGILAGGSSGAVVAAIRKLLPTIDAPARILTLLPDRGERYLDTVYDDAWLRQLDSERQLEVATGSRGG